jgi:hypothetical protein
MVFEDNNGALELATAPKMRPRTKHIAIKYHHFRSSVDSGAVLIDTKNQIADIFTKVLARIDFERLRVMLSDGKRLHLIIVREGVSCTMTRAYDRRICTIDWV